MTGIVLQNQKCKKQYIQIKEYKSTGCLWASTILTYLNCSSTLIAFVKGGNPLYTAIILIVTACVSIKVQIWTIVDFLHFFQNVVQRFIYTESQFVDLILSV